MKIALFSDIHANLPAFDALLADLDQRKPDANYCLGDLVGYNVWPNEIIAEIRKRGIATIAGNHDLKVEGIEPFDPVPTGGKNYAYHLVTPENRNYLLTLPAHIRLEFKFSSGKLNILLVHGSPREVDEYVLEDTDENNVLAMMGDADVLCVGHSHIPYHRFIQAPTGEIKQVINIGSAGKPKDGNPKGCYVMMNIEANPLATDIKAIGVEFVRFEYDIETAVKAIENSPLPSELAKRLRKAY